MPNHVMTLDLTVDRIFKVIAFYLLQIVVVSVPISYRLCPHYKVPVSSVTHRTRLPRGAYTSRQERRRSRSLLSSPSSIT